VTVNSEPWIGDESTDSPDGCHYSDKPGVPRCGAVATVHILSESAITGLLALSACDRHAPIARAAGPYLGEHAFGAGCMAIPSMWHDEGCDNCGGTE
jgi:hypothetical protein